MNVDNESLVQRIEICRRLYYKYKGQRHELIEREMRELGYADFHRRILYKRCERGRERPGWIDRFGWRGMIDVETEGRSDAAILIPASPRLALTASSPGDFDEFQRWLKRVSPGMTWDWEYQLHIYKHLKRVTEGKCKRLMIFIPPRHGKSELVTVRYAAWRLKQKPETNIIIGSYNQRLANRFSRKIRKVLADDHALNKYEEEKRGKGEEEISNQQVSSRRTPNSSSPPLPLSSSFDAASMFPFIRSRQANSEAEWETKAGGGLRAVGVGAGVTGYGLRGEPDHR